MSEVRHDPLSGDTVILAPARDSRPHSRAPAASRCPFCPGREEDTPPAVLELPFGDSKGWFVRVFPNLYPIVTATEPAEPPAPGLLTGAHEVIVETPDHDQELAQRTPEELVLSLIAYRERLQALGALPGVRYVSVFRNKGADAGSSLAHPHSQVVALSYVPRRIGGMVRKWRAHHRHTGRCLLCTELATERKVRKRVVLETGDFVLYTPPAGASSGEMILAPLTHRTSFGEEDDGALARLSPVLLSAAVSLRRAFDDPAYNLVLQTWPVTHRADGALHWYLRIVPRRAVLGGFELASGDLVSTLSPEAAAERYRQSLA